MPESELTRLTITWSKDTDLALRSHLGAQGLKKGALSKFVEDAVKWRLFDQTVTRVRQAFGDVPDRERHRDEGCADVELHRGESADEDQPGGVRESCGN